MTGVSERLDAIEARLGAATPGPWGAYAGCIRQDRSWRDPSEVVVDYAGERPGIPNALFIAHAPQDITELLDLARKQQAAIDALNDWCGRNKTGFYDEAQDDVTAIIRNALEGA